MEAAMPNLIDITDPTQAEITRFNSKWIAGKNGCHIWQAGKDEDGYGVFWLHGRTRRAHQVALLLAGRPVPEGFIANHTCRNKSCVNPQHLEAITLDESWRKDSSSTSYVNSQKTHCPEGHPYDRNDGRRRWCSICRNANKKRLRAKWKAEGRQVNW
jgi:hypothetical protein